MKVQKAERTRSIMLYWSGGPTFPCVLAGGLTTVKEQQRMELAMKAEGSRQARLDSMTH